MLASIIFIMLFFSLSSHNSYGHKSEQYFYLWETQCLFQNLSRWAQLQNKGIQDCLLLFYEYLFRVLLLLKIQWALIRVYFLELIQKIVCLKYHFLCVLHWLTIEKCHLFTLCTSILETTLISFASKSECYDNINNK